MASPTPNPAGGHWAKPTATCRCGRVVPVVTVPPCVSGGKPVTGYFCPVCDTVKGR